MSKQLSHTQQPRSHLQAHKFFCQWSAI